MKAPVVLFPKYKWRWATGTPTEGLNNPPVFIGVLRALLKHNGEAPNSESLIKDLEKVELDTKTDVHLARSADRNLIRNSGQYWKALGLLAPDKGLINVTELGAKLASGAITKTEFAAYIIKNLELPNRQIESNATVKLWEDNGLQIKPLKLILEILYSLSAAFGAAQAYVTPFELTHIIIPLAGSKAPLSRFTEAIGQFRRNELVLATWPNCTPESNDQRMAREFLLFLSNYGFCKVIPSALNANEKYCLTSFDNQNFVDFISTDDKAIGSEVTKNPYVSTTERQKVLTEITARPQQAAFRNKVLKAYGTTCILTGVTLSSVLEAAHIVPVTENGIDEVQNGLCLRADIHLLYDTGHLRIDPSGNVFLSATSAAAVNYGALPKQIKLPEFVSKEFIEWRWKYE